MINYQTDAATPESTKAVVSGKGILKSLIVTNVSSNLRYLYVFDSLTASGTLLCPPVTMNAGDTVTVTDASFSTGVYVASSSTLTPYTAAGGTDLSINAQGNQL